MLMKLIIADDEYIIREGIASIPWDNYGIEVAGIAENGIEALDIVKNTNADIVLTDIRMPGLSGIELIKILKQEFPHIKSILLTGYKDFDYAKAAISAGTLEYILKPTEPQEVIDAVIKAQNIIMNENEYKKASTSNNANDGIASYENIMETGNAYDVENINDIYTIIDSVKIFNYNHVEKLTRDLLNKVSLEKKANEKSLKETGYALIILSLKLLSETTTYTPDFVSSLKFHERINECQSKDLLTEVVIDLLIKIMNAMNNRIPANSVISSVQGFIEANYMKDITLISLAEHVHLNPIYLSRLLKKEKKHTFLELLTNIRMTKACELLSDPNYKTYEIAESVGIKDSRYFAHIFRKRYGVTPTEYRKSIITRNADKVD